MPASQENQPAIIIITAGESAGKIYDAIEVLEVNGPSYIIKTVSPDISGKERVDLLVRAKLDAYRAVGIEVSDNKLENLVRAGMKEARTIG